MFPGPFRELTCYWRSPHRGVNQCAIRDGNWKLVRDGRFLLLFDLSDPAKAHIDVGGQHPEKTDELYAKLRAWEREIDSGEKPFVLR